MEDFPERAACPALSIRLRIEMIEGEVTKVSEGSEATCSCVYSLTTQHM